MNSSLLTCIDQNLPEIVKTGTNKGKYRDKYMLILVNNKPITRYINSECVYAFLDIVSKEIVYMKKIHSRPSAKSAKTWYGIDENLEFLDIELSEHPELSDFEKFAGIQLDFTAYSYETEKYPGIVYAGVLEELDAIMFNTNAFIFLQKVALNQTSFGYSVQGVPLPQFISRNGTQIPCQDLIKQWYYGYMLEANIAISDIYWKSLGNTRGEPALTRMKILNEFVPILFKFEGIFNPIFDTTTWSNLVKQYPIIKGAFKVKPLCKVTGSYIKRTNSESFGMFTTRGLLSKIFKQNIYPETNGIKDAFNLKYFSSLMLSVLLAGSEETYNLNTLDYTWMVLSKEYQEDSEMVIDIVHTLSVRYGLLSFQKQQINFNQMLILEYLLYLEPKNPVGWYLGLLSQKAESMEQGSVLLNYLSNDLGGNILERSQTIVNLFGTTEV